MATNPIITVTAHKTIARKTYFTAGIGNTELCQSNDKQRALQDAQSMLADIASRYMSEPLCAVASDGSVLIAREYLKGQYSLCYHRALNASNRGMLDAGGCEMGMLLRDGNKSISLREMLTERLAQYDGAIA